MAGYIGSKAVLLSTTAATVTGDMTVDTSTLKVDSTNNLVGIGTASPTSALHVSGGAGTNIAIQSSAGTHWRIGDGVGSTNGNLVIYDYSDSRKVFEIDTLGHVTMPSQPAFLAIRNTTQSAMATGSAVTIQYATEIYDQNADFNTSTYTFTAPVTGRYLLNFSLYGMTLDSAANYYESYLNTSNRNYYSTIDPDYGQDNAYHTFAVTALADMDANDTVLVKIYQSGGSSQTTFGGGSHFSGYLVC